MNSTFLSVRNISIAVLFAGGTLAFAACSSDENTGPTKPPPVGGGGSGSDDASAGGSSGAGGSKAGGATGSGGSGGSDPGSGGSDPGSGGSDPGSGGSDPGSGGQGTIIVDAGGCQEDPTTDCYECPVNEQNVTFLNRCELSPGVPATVDFPNAQRIQRGDWQPGQPLP